MPALRTRWTDDKIALLTDLWEKDVPASEIARRLGDGCTKSAVVAKAHRLNLSSRPSPIMPLPDDEIVRRQNRREEALALPQYRGPGAR